VIEKVRKSQPWGQNNIIAELMEIYRAKARLFQIINLTGGDRTL